MELRLVGLQRIIFQLVSLEIVAKLSSSRRCSMHMHCSPDNRQQDCTMYKTAMPETPPAREFLMQKQEHLRRHSSGTLRVCTAFETCIQAPPGQNGPNRTVYRHRSHRTILFLHQYLQVFQACFDIQAERMPLYRVAWRQADMLL